MAQKGHLCAAVAQEDHHGRLALVEQLTQVLLQGRPPPFCWKIGPPWEKQYTEVIQ